jgi:hypothetical protein
MGWVFCKFLQDHPQFRIGTTTFFLEDGAEIGKGWRDAVEEVLLALEVATEAISAKDLKEAEEDEGIEDGGLEIEGGKAEGCEGGIEALAIDGDELVAKGLGIAGRGLPEEAGEIVVDGTAATALEIDEMGVAFSIEHDVAGLEVAVKERRKRPSWWVQKILCQTAEILFEAEFVEVEAIAAGDGLEEAVFEVVEVEEDIGFVHLGLGIADGEVETLGAKDLQTWQLGNSAS